MWITVGFALSFTVFLFALFIVTFPGEWQEENLPSWPNFDVKDQDGEPGKASLHDLIFNLPVELHDAPPQEFLFEHAQFSPP